MSRRATAEDLPAMTQTISRAFFEDPVWSWVFPDVERRAEQYAVWWGFLLSSALRYPWVCVTDDVEATAVWIPPNGMELTPAEEDLVPGMLKDLLGDGAPRALRAMMRFDESHPQHEPHYYLSLLGTHPDHRGNGLGVGLVADSLAEIDAAHAHAYLESSNPVNHARYELLGFEPYGEFTLPDGPSVLTMWRPAR